MQIILCYININIVSLIFNEKKSINKTASRIKKKDKAWNLRFKILILLDGIKTATNMV